MTIASPATTSVMPATWTMTDFGFPKRESPPSARGVCVATFTRLTEDAPDGSRRVRHREHDDAVLVAQLRASAGDLGVAVADDRADEDVLRERQLADDRPFREAR